MRLALIHLSDIHLKAEQIVHAKECGEKIGRAVRTLCHEADEVIVAISGDIAYSGKKEEYLAAESLISELRGHIKQHCKKDIGIAVCPGNHDLDFTSLGPKCVRNILVNAAKQNSNEQPDISVKTQVAEPFKEYLAFSSKVSGKYIGSDAILFFPNRFVFNGKQITVYSLNSAWCSSMSESKGQLICPHYELNPDDSQGDAVSIVMMHHPYPWLENLNSQAAKRTIELFSDVIITGHEHEGEISTRTTTEESHEFFEGGILSGGGTEDGQYSFNTVLIDIEKSTQLLSRWVYTDDCFVSAYHGTEIAFHKNKRRLQGQYALTAEFAKRLQEPNASYTHPSKVALSLDDIFVWPTFEYIDDKGDVTEIKEKEILNYIKENHKVLILGPEISGRSTLIKMLFFNIYNSEQLPLILDAAALKKVNRGSLDLLISDAISAQYQIRPVERFSQMNPSKKVVFVDNWERALKLSAAEKNELLIRLQREFGAVVILSSNEAQYDGVDFDTTHGNEIWKFRRVDIQDFGTLSRRRIIKKWYSVGQSSQATEEKTDDINRAEKYINTAIDSGIAKAYAPIIIMLLQALEVSRGSEKASASFIYLYETLIGQSLSKRNQRISIDDIRTVAAAIAFEIFESDLDYIEVRRAKEIIRQISTAGKTDIDFDGPLRELTNASIVVNSDDIIKFKFNYCFFYFAALFIHQNLDEFGEKLNVYARRLHHENTANVILYLTYLNRDKRILEAIQAEAQKMFEAYPPIDFDMFGTGLHAGVLPLDELEVHNGDAQSVERAREEIYAQEDNARRNIARSPTPPPDGMHSARIKISGGKGHHDAVAEVKIESKSPDAQQDIMQLNAAHKTIQILGQIIRNFPASMSGEKKESLSEECYLLGLRMLSCVHQLFNGNRKEIVAYIIHEDIFKCRSKGGSDSDIQDRALKIFSLIPQGSAFQILKHISDGVGASQYMKVYDSIRDRLHKDLPSVRIVDIAIRLDHSGSFPEREVINLERDLSDSTFSYWALKKLVWQRLTLFSTSKEIRQRVCQKLKLKHNARRMLGSNE